MNPIYDCQTTNPILECYNLTKSYIVNRNPVPVLNGINLSVNSGEIVVIKGKSGAGKSTLMEIMSGLTRPNSGNIYFDNYYLESLSNEKLANWRRKKVGIIFQNFNLIPTWTAFENVEAALMNNGFSKFNRQEKVKKQFNRIGLKDRIHHLPSELSIGQQQRVAIARAMINDPVLIFADEPTGEIDSETSKEIIDYLITPVKEKGVTLIVTTHGPFPLEIANKVFCLNDGIIQEKR
jgi:putative ABC transport system ATP-binding protein